MNSAKGRVLIDTRAGVNITTKAFAERAGAKSQLVCSCRDQSGHDEGLLVSVGTGPSVEKEVGVGLVGKCCSYRQAR